MAEPSGAAAVLGRPIGHSLSPLLHRAAYRAIGLDWTYDAIDCGVDDLPAVLRARNDWAGFSCTMPLKRAVVERADEVRPAARLIGAGNTLLPLPGGRWAADNTDVDGVVAALADAPSSDGPVPPDLSGRSVTVLGAGGTAQAVVAALARCGVRELIVLVRDPRRTSELLETAQRCAVTVRLQRWDGGDGRASSARVGSALEADVVVSTVPVGAADVLAQARWRPDQRLLDVVYDPWPTPLAAAAERAGADVRSGALMLLHQAAAQVTLMTGRPAPTAAMRAALATARPAAGGELGIPL